LPSTQINEKHHNTSSELESRTIKWHLTHSDAHQHDKTSQPIDQTI